MFWSTGTRTTAIVLLVAACAASGPGELTTQPSTQQPSAREPSAQAPTPVRPTESIAPPTLVATPTAAASPAAVVDPETIDPCSLVTAARVGEVIGEEVADGVLQESGDSVACFFDVPDWAVPIAIPQDSGVSIRVWRKPTTVAEYDPNVNSEQQVIAEVDGLGDAAWWRHHVELPNIHINTDDAVLTVITEPIRFHVAFNQIPNPVGVDTTEWLADLTELADDVLVALGR
jgi:hypothetical protein